MRRRPLDFTHCPHCPRIVDPIFGFRSFTHTTVSIDPFSVQQRVYYQHTDAGGVVYHAAYLDFMEAARTELLLQRGCDLMEIAGRDAVMFVVRGIRIDYSRPARLNDRLTITAEVAKVGFASLDFTQRVLRNANDGLGELLVSARVELGCVDPQSWKPARMPRSVRTTLGQIE
jgi:acyl-CoA thioester hydrolase